MPKYLKTKEGSLESAVESVSTAKKDEGFASDAQRKAAFASGYKEPKNKKKKEEGNAFGAALQAAKEKGEKTFTVAGKKFDVKTEEEKLDKVNPTAVKKKFDDRKDKDIDNDGDVDDSDKFLHKRRKAISKAVKGEEVKEETTLAMKAAQYISSMWAEAAAEKDGVKTKSEEEEEPKKNGKTMTGKEMSKVEVTPKDKV